ncbi:tetratricopeptide repeat protein [Methanotorris formicicus]|nr:hypothetical protein [Methanotorris formicicus]
MFEFLHQNPIVDFFAQFGLLGFIVYMVLVYGGLFWIGIELKNRGIFEYLFLRLIYAVILTVVVMIAFGIIVTISGISIECLFFMVIIIGVITLGILWAISGVTTTAIALIIAIIVALIIVNETKLLTVEIAIFGIFWVIKGETFAKIVLGTMEKIAERIAWEIVVITTVVIILAISGVIVLLSIETSTLGIVWAIAGGVASGITVGIAVIITLVIVWAIIKTIAELKYKKAMEYLKNNKIDNCLKYLNQSLYLLRDYDEDSYFDMDFANKIISIRNNLKLIQKANDYYNSGNYKEALKLYEEMAKEYPNLKGLFKNKYQKLKSQIEKQFKEELKEIDELFRNNEINDALKKYKQLLNKYPEFENQIKPKIQKCEEILKNPPIEALLSKAKKYSSEALDLFNQNKLKEAINMWKEAIKQYENAGEIAILKEDENIINSINKNIKALVHNILKAEIKLINDKLGRL